MIKHTTTYVTFLLIFQCIFLQFSVTAQTKAKLSLQDKNQPFHQTLHKDNLVLTDLNRGEAKPYS